VAGPDGLRAVVRTDDEHHARVFVEDARAGTTSLLLDAWTCLPRWSPDGRWIACDVWRSIKRHAELTIVDARARTPVIDPDVAASLSDMKWSPDSRTIAADGGAYDHPGTVLYTVAIPGGAVSVLDTCATFSDYDFSWSPNGRWIAFARPTEVDPVGGDPIAADLWVVEPATGTKQQLLFTPDWIEGRPLWITDRTIQIDQVRWSGDDWEGERQRVVELAPPDTAGSR
jgi:Tol biopolymer transport system component